MKRKSICHGKHNINRLCNQCIVFENTCFAGRVVFTILQSHVIAVTCWKDYVVINVRCSVTFINQLLIGITAFSDEQMTNQDAR